MTTETPATDRPPLDLDAIEEQHRTNGAITSTQYRALLAEVTALRAELDAARAETERLGRKWEQAFADVRDQRDAARADLQIAQRANDIYAAEDAARAERTEPATVECLTCNGRGGNWNCMGLAPEDCLCGVCTDNATCPGCGAEATRPEPATATGCGRRSVTGDCPDHPLPEPATGEDVQKGVDALAASDYDDLIPLEYRVPVVDLILAALDLPGRERALREAEEQAENFYREFLRYRADAGRFAAERDDYAARLKATDASWAQVAAERDAANAALAEVKRELAEERTCHEGDATAALAASKRYAERERDAARLEADTWWERCVALDNAVADMESERDEARMERDNLASALDQLKAANDALHAERDAARAEVAAVLDLLDHLDGLDDRVGHGEIRRLLTDPRPARER